MVKYNSTILLIAVVGLAVATSGCTNSNEQTQKSSIPTSYIPISTPASTSPPIVNQYSTMSFTEFDEAMLSNDLTTLQKENLYVNKIFRWDGQVKEVTQATVTIEIRRYVNYKMDDVTNYEQKYCASYNNDIKIRQSCSPTNIRLHVSDDQKSQLNSLSKGDIITFEGTIKDTQQHIRQNLNFVSGIDMYNGKIIEY